MDTERCQYLLISYLRIRLQKVCSFVIWIHNCPLVGKECYLLSQRGVHERTNEWEWVTLFGRVFVDGFSLNQQ